VSLRPKGPVVDRNVTGDHYDRLAATYEQNWAYSPAFVEWMTDCIKRRLRITERDLVADIGCGTGLFARELARYAAAVVCAEPSAPMLAQVPADDKLIPVAASAEDLAAGRVGLPHDGYDAILLKEVLHHVEFPAAVIAGLARLLRPGGRMLVVMLPTQISYPLFAAALELFTAHQPDPAIIAGNMHTAGLYSALTYQSFPLTFPAERYLQMVGDRYMSLLSHFDDAELKAGVEEIRQAHPGETIAFTDTFAFVLGTAP
jgi:2-polyprenyl-3-methyl-5-hydroxy-6-metoxy-1,4-benzoquinol methylase